MVESGYEYMLEVVALGCQVYNECAFMRSINKCIVIHVTLAYTYAFQTTIIVQRKEGKTKGDT